MSWKNKKYSRINWKNRPSTATALGARNLNKMDVFLNEVDDALIEFDAQKLNISTANGMLKSMTIDTETWIITATQLDGTQYIWDLNLEKIPVSFSLSEDGVLTMTTEDGTVFDADIGNMIKDYVFDDSDTIAFQKQFQTSESDTKGTYHVTAVIKAGSVHAEHLDPDYRADILEYKNAAQTAAGDSLTYSRDSKRWAVGDEEYEGSETDSSKYYSTLSESYTRGGTGTRPGEDLDNAKKYYEQAKSISESFSGALRPMGTVAFSELPAVGSATEGDMYNISDSFTTTADFKEGAGHRIPAGANVYLTTDAKWDILAGTPVIGVKGAKETDFRTGDVNISPADIGAPSIDNAWILEGGTEIPDNGNLNDYTTVGNYYSQTGTGIANLPPYESGAFILKIFNGDGIGFRVQQIRFNASQNSYYRVQINFIWQPWHVILNDQNGATLKYGTVIPENSNLNDYAEPGNYYCPLNVVAATLKNCPFGEAFTMKIILGSGTGYPTQIVRNFYSGRIAYRLGGDWGAWNYILTNTDVLNDLTSAIVDRPLSANMGAYLKNLIGNGATGYTRSVNVDEMPIGITWVNGYSQIQGTVPWTGVHYIIVGQGEPGKTCLSQVAINRSTGEVKARGRDGYGLAWSAWTSSYATKSELSSYATKSELSSYATKSDLDVYTTVNEANNIASYFANGTELGESEYEINISANSRNVNIRKIGKSVFVNINLIPSSAVSNNYLILRINNSAFVPKYDYVNLPASIRTSNTAWKASALEMVKSTLNDGSVNCYIRSSIPVSMPVVISGYWETN